MATITSMGTAAPMSSMNSTFPVLLPRDDSTGNEDAMSDMEILDNDGFETISEPVKVAEGGAKKSDGSKFMEVLFSAKPLSHHEVTAAGLAADNRMFTENQGIAHISTTSALLDLFSELEKTVSAERLKVLLEAAWKENPLATLKIIWNARSIHLGKGEQESFYRCMGWMKDEHPKTVIANLPWLVRSTIEKKVKKEDPDDAILVDGKPTIHEGIDVLHGGSHGYWKDLLNILALAVNKKLDVLGDPRQILHTPNEQKSKGKSVNAEISASRYRTAAGKRRQFLELNRAKKARKVEKLQQERLKEAADYNAKQKSDAKERKHAKEKEHHGYVVKMLETSAFYRSLHFATVRLFAEQLRKDMDLLNSGKREDLNRISLAGKWAPSLEGFHDKHTFICSSIAEALFPMSVVGEPHDTREMYLRRARESYRRFVLAPLRKALEVVERDISAGAFEKINYAKVPSLAMNNYKNLFAQKDLDRYAKYIDRVAEGKARISGAVLMPATLIKEARTLLSGGRQSVSKKKAADQLLAEKIATIQDKTLDGQWASLVQRIRENGTLTSSIAVCDVSGSMYSPSFPDHTCPLDTSIGLSLLLAEITAPPFGGSFITFSANPHVCNVGGPNDKRLLREKISAMISSDWSMNTDFVAVFERLLLPMAIKYDVKPDEMVKQVFVFSDMQFDDSQDTYHSYSSPKVEKWETAYERIERKFKEAGYVIPRLIFWNLAGGRAGYNGGGGDEVAPKPVTGATENTLLVGGYSQGMMKMFLEGGTFDAEDDDVEMEEGVKEEGEDGMIEVKKKKVTPMDGMWKAIGHKAYDMLKVVD